MKEKKYRYTAYPTQMEAMQSVREKKADAVVIDMLWQHVVQATDKSLRTCSLVFC